jgi:hypothetical protein
VPEFASHNFCSLCSRECNSEQLDSIPPDADDLSFGNDVYRIRFEERDNRPLFGHRYHFYLKDAVDDVPEYVVRWNAFVKLVVLSVTSNGFFFLLLYVIA